MEKFIAGIIGSNYFVNKDRFELGKILLKNGNSPLVIQSFCS